MIYIGPSSFFIFRQLMICLDDSLGLIIGTYVCYTVIFHRVIRETFNLITFECYCYTDIQDYVLVYLYLPML